MTEAHSLSGDVRGRNLSAHGKKSTDRGALTSWRRQREGTCQATERNRPTEAHSLSGDGRGMDLSGHRKEPTDRGALTLWRRQKEGLVRTQKGADRPRRTHFLETAEGGNCQDTERNPSTEAHSLPGDSRGIDLSGHRKKLTDRGTLTLWRRQREGLVR